MVEDTPGEKRERGGAGPGGRHTAATGGAGASGAAATARQPTALLPVALPAQPLARSSSRWSAKATHTAWRSGRSRLTLARTRLGTSATGWRCHGEHPCCLRLLSFNFEGTTKENWGLPASDNLSAQGKGQHLHHGVWGVSAPAGSGTASPCPSLCFNSLTGAPGREGIAATPAVLSRVWCVCVCGGGGVVHKSMHSSSC